MSSKHICLVTISNTLKYWYNVVFLFHCSLVITVPSFLCSLNWIFISSLLFFLTHTNSERKQFFYLKNLKTYWKRLRIFLYLVDLFTISWGGGIWDFPPYSQTSRSVHILSYLYLSTLLSIYLSHMYLSIKLSLAFTITDFSSVL